MSKNCVICGNYSGNYPFCYKHMHEMIDGKIIKCKQCNTWHYADSPCKCMEETYTVETSNNYTTTRKNKDEIEYRCQDGHWVKSKSERDIDNYLYNHNIRHAYENTIHTDENVPIHPDFYLPDYDAYLEHWGYGKERKGYTITKIKKLEYYRRSGLTLICTYEDNDAQDIESALDYKLKHFAKGKVNFDDPSMTLELANELEAELTQRKEINSYKTENKPKTNTLNQPQSTIETPAANGKEIKELPGDSQEQLKQELPDDTNEREESNKIIIGFIIFMFVFLFVCAVAIAATAK